MSQKYSKKEQAKFLLKPKHAPGMPRSKAKSEGLISSNGTARVYCSHLSQFIGYLYKEKICKPGKASAAIGNDYLEFRSMYVKQKTLNADRQALEMVFGWHLNFIASRIPTILESRAYSYEEIQKIKSHQNEKNRLSTEIASFGGLRAFEIGTIARTDEQPRTPNRNWPRGLFKGIDTLVRYTVHGKGGLIREFALSEDLACRLETRRLAKSRWVEDRKIFHFQRYDLAFGQSWSQSFSYASLKMLGFSTGAHGMRHTYAQERLRTLLRLGFNYEEARRILSSELGHFRPDVTEVYLR